MISRKGASGSGTRRDVPVVPDPRVRYAPASKQRSSYTVRAASGKKKK